MTQQHEVNLEYHRGNDYAVVMRPNDTTDTAVCHLFYVTNEEADFYGHLFAAAPKLLAALEHHHKFGLDIHGKDYIGTDTYNDTVAVLSKLRGGK